MIELQCWLSVHLKLLDQLLGILGLTVWQILTILYYLVTQKVLFLCCFPRQLLLLGKILF